MVLFLSASSVSFPGNTTLQTLSTPSLRTTCSNKHKNYPFSFSMYSNVFNNNVHKKGFPGLCSLNQQYSSNSSQSPNIKLTANLLFATYFIN